MMDKPIIFSAPMVRALLDGRKTQTRRVLKPQPCPTALFVSTAAGMSYDAGKERPFGIVPYTPGDRLIPAMEIPSLNRNYCADVFGAIWSRAGDGKTWSRLKGSPTTKGYLSVTPAHGGKYRTRLVHRLVAEAFYGYEPNGFKQVRHLNGDQAFNAPENLDWGTHEDNWSDRLAHGKHQGEEHHSSKLTNEQVSTIKKASASQRALAKKFGVAQSTIWAIKSGRLWRDDIEPSPPNFPRWASRLTLTVTDVRVQRVQGISEADAMAEGIDRLHGSNGPNHFSREIDGAGWMNAPTAQGVFADLWNSIHGPEAWAANPWVAAISFTVHRGNIDQ